ncbi:hypothetical protein Pla22_41010 [Rubripirellula amarantea]|uniref:Uncharacterized protein n=1 Tax=Rubripirellula amarantea TaxID=2527999 RepID=A0A5C5WKM3_9BACT|nr:hypothetical protein Pla22_41010 [Rubripirellula amarantea]
MSQTINEAEKFTCESNHKCLFPAPISPWQATEENTTMMQISRRIGAYRVIRE